MRGTVQVIGKFRKEHDVPMQPDAGPTLEDQLEEDGKLWRQNPQRLREVLAQGSARAKIPSLTPHVLRHNVGTRWLEGGGDIYKLSKSLGHSTGASPRRTTCIPNTQPTRQNTIVKEAVRAASGSEDFRSTAMTLPFR
jgi:integrase